MKKHLTAALIALTSNTGYPQTSSDYSNMGAATWAAFECSTLAAHAGEAVEQERLFSFGYRQGQRFVSALQSGKISDKDRRDGPPIVMMLVLQGPSVDFMLGRVFESAQDYALKDVISTGGTYNPQDLQQTLARSKYQRANCALIGDR